MSPVASSSQEKELGMLRLEPEGAETPQHDPPATPAMHMISTECHTQTEGSPAPNMVTASQVDNNRNIVLPTVVVPPIAVGSAPTLPAVADFPSFS